MISTHLAHRQLVTHQRARPPASSSYEQNVSGVLVVFYFATPGGASWSDPASFLTFSLNACSWSGSDVVDGNITGVLCAEEGSLSLIFC